MKIFNTETRNIVDFKPSSNVVGVYNCGPTVYDFAHIGNLRAFLFADLLRRVLEISGYSVKQVMNITDVGHLVSDSDDGEDKIEKGARRENKSAYEVAKYYEEQFKMDIDELNIQTPTEMPRATEHIKEQIELIKTLEEKGFTYKTSDGIYYDTSKFKNYANLANLDLKGLQEGARVEANPEKRNITDFALWKFSYPNGRPFDQSQDDADSRRQMEWESPWGLGFPGWHIECSAMSVKYLGQPFDIHTGGIDHIPIHHTNEIAQSEAAFEKPLANYWMHSEFLSVDNQKMSKSLGNFYTLRDIKDKGYSPLDFRYLCLQSHYRSKLNFTWAGMEAAKNSRIRLKNIAEQLSQGASEIKDGGVIDKSKYMIDFKTRLFDDLNTPEALAIVWEMLRDDNIPENEKLEILQKLDKTILALDLFESSRKSVPEDIASLVEERSKAKADKDYGRADEIRNMIEVKGYSLKDSPDGTRVTKI